MALHLSNEVATAARIHLLSTMDQAPASERLMHAATFMIITEIAAPHIGSFYTSNWKNYACVQYEEATQEVCPWINLGSRHWRAMGRYSASYFLGGKNYEPTDEEIVNDLLMRSPELQWTRGEYPLAPLLKPRN